MIFARRGEGQQAAARPRNGDECGVKDRDAENQERREPAGEIAGVFEAEFQSECRHQEAEEHGAAVAHEDFCGLEIVAEEAGGAAENRGGQRGDERLTVEIREHGEKDRCHGGDASAETVHVVEDAEGSSDADDPEDGECSVEQICDVSVNENLKNLGVDSAGEKNSGGERHGKKQFDLVMQPAFVVEETDGGDERGAGDDACALGACGAVEGEEMASIMPPYIARPPRSGIGCRWTFRGPGRSDHADAQSERANRDSQHQR